MVACERLEMMLVEDRNHGIENYPRFSAKTAEPRQRAK